VTRRPATRADIPALARLVRACDASHAGWAGPDVTIPSLAAEELEWELRLSRAGAWAQLVEDEERPGEVAGVVAFAGAQVSREDRTPVAGLAHVGAVFVHPDRWRRGIARGLLAAAEDAMRTQGFERAQLWTLEGSPAERLYTALGWRRDGRRDIHPPLNLPIVAYVNEL
jgi:GNAT superfamily N-acetyltransferase